MNVQTPTIYLPVKMRSRKYFFFFFFFLVSVCLFGLWILISTKFNTYCLSSVNADNEINFYNFGLVETFKKKWHTLALKHKSKKTDLICFECEQNSATKKCIQCEQNYCQQCSEQYHVGRIMRSHQIINIDNSSVPLVNGYCSQHNQKSFTSYCKECKIHLCVDCVSKHSNEHDVANIAELVSV